MAESNDPMVDEQVAETPDQGEQGTERTDWKAKAIELEAKFKAENGIRRRLEKDLKQRSTPSDTDAKAQGEPQDKQAKGFDYGQLAYLETKGVNHAEDVKYLEDLAKESGTELRDLLGKNWVQAELKERKEQRASEAATPSGSKGAGNASRDSVEYWQAKIESGQAKVTDIPDRQLRFKVVEARRKAKTQTDVFYNS